MNIYSIPLGDPFLKVFAQNFLKNHDSYARARSLIFAPTRRACNQLVDILCQEMAPHSTLLPRIMPLGEFDEDEIALNSFAGSDFLSRLPPAIDREKRMIMLATLVKKIRPTPQTELSFVQAMSIAHHLGLLMDEFYQEGLDLRSLEDMSPSGKAADHWDHLLQFLKILSQHWPIILKENNMLDAMVRRKKILDFQMEEWRQKAPDFPIIIAGSTGSISSTANLMEVVSKLPLGQIILPGLQKGLDHEILPEYHPQHSLYALLKKLGVCSSYLVKSYDLNESVTNRSIAFAPAFDEKPFLSGSSISSFLLDKFFYSECATLGEEADLISLYIRESIHMQEKVICVTKNTALIKRIQASLKKFDIHVTFSSKKAFAETLYGSFLLCTAQCLKRNFSYLDFLIALKNPLSQKFSTDILVWEEFLYKNPMSFQQKKMEFLDKINVSEAFKKAIGFCVTFHGNIKSVGSLKQYLEAHEKLMCLIMQTDNLFPASQESNNSEERFASHLWFNLIHSSQNLDVDITDYDEFFKTFMDSVEIAKMEKSDQKQIEFLAPLDARLASADRVILADMNEGNWPLSPLPDPFFSLSMKQNLGLPSIAKRQGQSAHDFLQLCNIKEVFITRSLTSEGSTTLPSSFLSLLLSFLKEKNHVPTTPLKLQKWSQTLSSVLSRPSVSRPMPCPEIHLRPKKISVTDIQLLIKDPYSFYAKLILGLKPLASLTDISPYQNFGICIHQCMEQWAKLRKKITNEDIESLFVPIFEDFFKDVPYKEFWQIKFKKILNWLQCKAPIPTVDHILTEVWGNMSIGSFTIIAKADRIDLAHGYGEIIDYKTGQIPSDKDLETKGMVQLPLEAAILKHGQFNNINNQPTVLTFWDLGSKDGPSIHTYQGDLENLIHKTYSGLINLLKQYNNPKTSYMALSSTSYLHLARTQEWRRL